MNQTATDLTEDLLGLAKLAESCAARAFAFKGALEEHPYVDGEAESLFADARELAKRLREEARGPWDDQERLARGLAVKREGAELMRILQGKLGYVLSSLDWQSPSFLHSLRHQAGRQAGRIVGTENDYKRDMHLDAFAYEAAWRSAYVDAPLRLPPVAYATVSGMAAMTTLVGLLQNVYKMEGAIIVGRGCYFENRWILERSFRGRVTLVDDMDAAGIVRAAESQKAAAVFLDTLCNAHDVAMPNLPALIPELARVLGPRGFLVLDNTARATAFQPFRYLPRVGGPRLFVIESLNKFHQFGFDRVTGGIVWTQGGLPTGMIGAREHMGTNVPDASLLALPWPDRELLDRRLARLGRNARVLAERLDAFAAAHPNAPLERAVYPGLPSHPAYDWAKDEPFQGAFLALAFRPAFARVGYYQSFLARAVAGAARRGIQLVGGSSFGLDATRVYLTARHATRITTPFVRVAPGTETADEIRVIGDVLEAALLE